MKILLLSCSTGEGHNHCALAVREAFAAGDTTVAAPGGESYGQVIRRVRSWLGDPPASGRGNLRDEKTRGSGSGNHYHIAGQNPACRVVFLGVGFETTAPTVAASVLQAAKGGVPNYYVLSMHKVCPPAIRAILDSGEVKVSGLICPGHVSAVAGSRAWDFIALDYGIPCVVSGFEPLDILQAVRMLVDQLEKGESRVEIAYRRGVTPDGNRRALEVMAQVFEPCPARWRGLGAVPGSGLRLRDAYRRFDAEAAFDFDPGPTVEPEGCICGEVLRAVRTPRDCGLFRTVCTPASPVGPCMVSSEGACAACYLYGAADE